jgi:oxygen-independent coproporphyrinogen III oxidase
MTTTDALLSPYAGYVYAYPHKTAYRPLDPRPTLRDVWAGEATGALFLYLHIPFCEMRCGFCNLFTRTGAPEELVGAYLDALERQAAVVRDALPFPRFVTAAIGGGTPTYLSAGELTRLFDLAENVLGAGLRAVPLSVETSPATATADRLAVLAERGTARVSIGVQSFVDAEARAAVRPQRRAEVDGALDRIRAASFEALNIDLIYGIDGQTPKSWRYSLDTALSCEYCCQTDGMVGLGCGARSYTRDLHYSHEYAVGAQHVRAIIDEFVRLPADAFAVANVGFRLDEEDRRRRHLIQSVLQAEGMSRDAYHERFGSDVLADFGGELDRFAGLGWLDADADTVRLTAEGLAYSDAIGPALFSGRVEALMHAYEER